ncbi:MAG: trehalase family glycosidase [Anaerolineaceae bacterium]|nr:trehalase family glycosidase [Anaerolineaceae bacterium]
MKPKIQLELLKNRIDLKRIPFSERGSRILVMRHDDSLSIRLSERWFKLDHRLSSYRERPPIVDDIVFTDTENQILSFTCESYPHRLDFQTKLGQYSMVFLDSESLLLVLPSASCGLSFRVHVDQGLIDRRGGTLRLTGDIRRNFAYTTDRPMTVNVIEPEADGTLRVQLMFASGEKQGLLLNLTPRLGFNRHIPGIDEAFDQAAKRWQDWFDAVPPVSEPYLSQYAYAWWVMRSGLISTRFFITREAMTPSKIHYVGVWQWDAFFHALAYSHIDKQLAEDQFRVILDHQRPDGMLPDAVHDEGTVTHLNFPVDADVTKPPLLAWAAWHIYQESGDREFLAEIYEPVVRWNRWWFEKNDLDGDGLCEYQHPFSSGLDDSPLWDEGMPVTAPDLNTYLVLQTEALSRIASVLGLTNDAQTFERNAQALLDRMVAQLWDAEAGLFWAKRNGQILRVKTPFNLLPLITGRLPETITKKLVEHLINPQEFWLTYPIPSVARDDPQFSLCQMWRGPTWINVNYLFIEGLQRCGYSEIAHDLRLRTLDLVMKHADLFEYYDPDTGEPCPKAAPIFGWSAALFIDLVLQEMQEMQADQQDEIKK